MSDNLRFKGDDGNLGGVGSEKRNTIQCDILMSNVDTPTSRVYWALSDDGSGSERIYFYHDPTWEVPVLYCGTVDLRLATTDCSDGIKHNIKAVWETDFLRIYVDGVNEGGTDTSTVVPDDLNWIDIGQFTNSAIQPNCLISNFKIFRKIRI